MKKISPKTSKTVRLVYGWVFTAFTFVVGALFIWQVLDIYLGGQSAGLSSSFSYDIVSERIKKVLAAPFWIWIALIAVGFILWEVFSVEEKLKPITDARYILSRLDKRIPAEVGEELAPSMSFVKNEKRTLKIIHGCLLGLVAAYVIYIIIYMCIPANFPNLDKTREMLNLLKNVYSVALVVFAAGCAYVIVYGYSAKRQLPHVKKLTKGIKEPQPVEPNKFNKIVSHKYFILGVRIAVGCFGVAFVIAGLAVNNFASVMEVFNKAIRICTECIGLG